MIETAQITVDSKEVFNLEECLFVCKKKKCCKKYKKPGKKACSSCPKK